jgi:hypothetical protein
MIRTSTRVFAGCLAALATACTTLSSETRIPSTLQASEFNDTASQYMERPTFVSVQSFSDGNIALQVLVDEYGTGYDPALGITTPHTTFFDKRYVADYLPLFDKYSEWEALAAERGDLIDREIGTAKTWGVGGDIELRFGIYSPKTSQHLLTVERCAFGTCVNKALNLTRSNASALRSLLVDFAAGRIGHVDTQGVYK